MIKNYLTVALRNLMRYRGFTAINILGLAVGMAGCILIFLFSQEVFSYGAHHTKGDRIYRLLRKTTDAKGNEKYSTGISGPAGPALNQDFPETEAVTQLLVRDMWIGHGDKGFTQSACLADANIFDVFDYPTVNGQNPKELLKTPYTALITPQLANHLFGNINPVGKVVTLDYKWFKKDFTVAGLLQAPPTQSLPELQFEFLSTTVFLEGYMHQIWRRWRPVSSFRPLKTYVLLHKDVSHKTLEQKLPNFMAKYMGDEVAKANAYHLQPFNRIFLYSLQDYGYKIRGYGDINTIYTFGAIGAFIMLIACVNFINLSTARAATRAREVGLRKVVGALRNQLIRQFMGEAILLSMAALIVALALAESTLPLLNNFLGYNLTLDITQNHSLLLNLLLIVIIVSIAAGAYPALFMSAFQPTQALKGELTSGATRAWLRKTLVIFQFSISIVLIISTTVVYLQSSYLQQKDLGFHRKSIIMLPIFDKNPELIRNIEGVKRAFLQYHDVLQATHCGRAPGLGGTAYFAYFKPEGFDDVVHMNFLSIDEDFAKTFDLQIVAGRNLSKDIATDSDAYLINETAAKRLGWKDPIGKRLDWPVRAWRNGTVVGVVKDFHDFSLRDPIGPMVLWKPKQDFSGQLALRIQMNNLPETLETLKKQWKAFVPDQAFAFEFLDERLDTLYREQQSTSLLYGLAALLAVLIACLGLFGLASFVVYQRAKEVGVRKILGASIFQIVFTLSKDFITLVAISILIAWPVAYYLMCTWLDEFAYRMNLGIGSFLFGGLLALLIAQITVSHQAIKAAQSNPIDALRQE